MPSKIISLWSGPRNVSTALMYSFAQRSDTQVIDEPLYAHYLQHTGNNLNCVINIRTTQEVVFQFNNFDTEQGYDVLSVYSDSVKVFDKSGALTTFNYTTPTAAVVQIMLLTDMSVSSRGFEVAWYPASTVDTASLALLNPSLHGNNVLL